MDEKMVKEVTVSAKDRAKAIKKGSSAYNYYMNTPLSELNSREEKLIKNELKLLVESDSEEETPFESTAKTVGSAVIVGGTTYGGIVGYFMKWKDGLNKETISNATSQANSYISGTLSDIWNSIKSQLSNVWDYTGGRAIEHLTPYINSFGEKITEKIISLANYFSADIKDSSESIQNGAKYTIITAIIIVGLAALWKIYKFFFKKKPVSESFQIGLYTPFKNNIALGIINEADEMTNSENSEEVNALESESKPYIIKTADRLVDVLLQDPDFMEYTNSSAPELITELEKFKARDKSTDDEDSSNYEKTEEMIDDYKSEDEPMESTEDENGIQTESIKTIYNKARKLLIESDSAPMDQEKDTSVENIDNDDLENNVVDNGSTTSTFDKIISAFKSVGKAAEDTVTYVKDKIIDFKKKYFDKSPHILIRWMPAIVEMALTVLAVAYLWKKNGGLENMDTSTAVGTGAVAGLGTAAAALSAPSDTSEEIPSEDQQFTDDSIQEAKRIDFTLNNYFGALSLVTEITDKIEKKELLRPVTKSKPINVDKILEGISGTGEKLASNIITKAKSVSTDLLNDSEFITFSKRNNPEILSMVKKVNKFSGDCCK